MSRIDRQLMTLVGLLGALTRCSSPMGVGLNGAPTADCSSLEVEVDPPADAKPSIADVETVLARSCALGGCHAGSPGAGDLTFPLPLDSGKWKANVVGQFAHENPSMMLVEPGDPSKSWMMHKVIGEPCAFASACDAELGCGQRMPFGQVLSKEEIATIVTWVRAGAPN